MKQPSTHIKSFDFLDNLEVFQASDYLADFPMHFHDVISLTLVQRQCECTEVGDLKLLTPPGSLSLTYPDEIHANPNINDGSYAFLTYYLSPDVFRHFNGGKDFIFRERVIQDNHLYHLLFTWAINKQAPPEKEAHFTKIMHYLAQFHLLEKNKFNCEKKIDGPDLTEVLDFIQHNLNEKISLEMLANMLDLSRFAFIRRFKKVIGITPAQYLTIKRVEAAKKILRRGNSLVDTALSVGFYDQSHLTNNFKRLTGMTPKVYQTSSL